MIKAFENDEDVLNRAAELARKHGFSDGYEGKLKKFLYGILSVPHKTCFVEYIPSGKMFLCIMNVGDGICFEVSVFDDDEDISCFSITVGGELYMIDHMPTGEIVEKLMKVREELDGKE